MTLRVVSAAIVFSLIIFSGCTSMKINKYDTQSVKTFEGEDFVLNYLLYLPDNYNNTEKFPLVLFLHGSGERGDDIEKVKTHGPPKLISQGKKFSFILVSPQCPENKRWDPEQLSMLLDEIEKNYKIDKNRIYITGLSMGGYGAWKIAQTFPDRFAAIIPVCGGGDFLNACVIKHLPIWVFHGSLDKVVSIQESERMVNTLKRCDGNVKFTVYPEAKHDSWTETYNNPAVYEWMLNQKKN